MLKLFVTFLLRIRATFYGDSSRNKKVTHFINANQSV